MQRSVSMTSVALVLALGAWGIVVVVWAIGPSPNAEYGWSQIEHATVALNTLPAIVLAAVAAFLCKSRAVFFAGVAGALLGYVLTSDRMRSTGGDNFSLYVEAVRWNSLICAGLAAAAVSLGLRPVAMAASKGFQFGLRAMFLLTAAVALLTWTAVTSPFLLGAALYPLAGTFIAVWLTVIGLRALCRLEAPAEGETARPSHSAPHSGQADSLDNKSEVNSPK